MKLGGEEGESELSVELSCGLGSSLRVRPSEGLGSAEVRVRLGGSGNGARI